MAEWNVAEVALQAQLASGETDAQEVGREARLRGTLAAFEDGRGGGEGRADRKRTTYLSLVFPVMIPPTQTQTQSADQTRVKDPLAHVCSPLSAHP